MSISAMIIHTDQATHDVRRLRVEKPVGFRFVPGQAANVAIDRDGWREKARPFSFTSLNDWPALEFTIKIYPHHEGVTAQVASLKPGDKILIGEPFGAIRYEGKGCFIAGGAGITPFIAMIRDLRARGELAGNRLIFSNKTESDIILREEFESMKGLDCLLTVTEDPESDLPHGEIDEGFLARHVSDFTRKFYVCGPPRMVEDVSAALRALGADPDDIVTEGE